MEEIKLNENYEKKHKNKTTIVVIIGVVVFIVIFILLLLPLLSGDDENNALTDRYSYITYSNYVKIQDGMTYAEVVEIFDGHEGKLTTSSSVGGYTLAYYSWSDEYELKTIVIGFENGCVCARSQIGLD